MNIQNGSTQIFSHLDFKAITFDYTLSEQWSVNKMEEQDKGCRIFLNWEKSIMPSLPYIYVNEIMVDKPPILENTKITPLSYHYIQHTKTSLVQGDKKHILKDEINFYLANRIIRVGLELYSESGMSNAKMLDRTLFWKIVIESFRETNN